MDDRYKIDDNDAYNWTLKKKLSEYNQEELAEELINYKNDLKNEANIRIGGEYGFALTTAGLDTKEQFLEKYGEILDKAGMPKNNKVEQKAVPNKALSKLLTDYTQEEFADLMMSGKAEGKDNIVKYRGIEFTSEGIETKEEFINKYQEEFRQLRIKPEVKETTPVQEEQIVAPTEGGLVEATGDAYESTEQIPTEQVEPVEENTLEPVIEEPVKEELGLVIDSQKLIPALLDMLYKKMENGKDVVAKYNNNIISTEDCMSIKDIIVKYKDMIASAMKNKTEEALKTNIGREGKYLFELSRGNIYNDISTSDGIDLAAIREKEEEYRNIMAKRDTIDFEDRKQVNNWLNELVPYVNTHALNLNLGSNISLDSPDKYILDLMQEHGYTTEINYNNVTDYNSYAITDKLRDLEEYGFFASEYVKLPQEYRKLNSNKSLAAARIKALNEELYLCEYGINEVDKKLEETRQETNAEKEAIDAYRKACVSKAIEDVSYATEAINAISNEDLKIELTQALNKGTSVSQNNELLYITSPEDKEKEQVEREERLNKLKEKYTTSKNKILSSKAELQDKYKLEETHNLEKLEQEIQNFGTDIDEKIEKLKEEAIDEAMQEAEEELAAEKQEKKNKKGKGFGRFRRNKEKEDLNEPNLENENNEVATEEPVSEPTPEENAQEEVAPVPEPTDEKEEDTNQVQEPVAQPEEDEEDLNFDLPNNDSIDQFTQIRSIKKITKELYDKITSIKYKNVLQKAINKLNENKRAVITGAGLAISVIAGAMSLESNTDKLISNHEIESTTSNLNKVEQDSMLLDTLESVDTVENENTGKSM